MQREIDDLSEITASRKRKTVWTNTLQRRLLWFCRPNRLLFYRNAFSSPIFSSSSSSMKVFASRFFFSSTKRKSLGSKFISPFEPVKGYPFFEMANGERELLRLIFAKKKQQVMVEMWPKNVTNKFKRKVIDAGYRTQSQDLRKMWENFKQVRRSHLVK